MCGISGIYSFNSKNRSLRLRKIDHSIKHRGKDANGEIARNNNIFCNDIYFAHRRLSILDLSNNSNQPLINKNNKTMIVFNGEIYNFKELRDTLINLNYKFYSKSDTEVLLHCYAEWGFDFVKFLKGMYAFAIWDESKKTLFCARDEFGVKPFFYKLNDNSFEFASESRALYENENLNFFNIQSFFLGMYSPFGNSIYEGVNSLNPGHYLIVKDGKINIKKYFDIHENIPKKEKPNKNDLDQIKFLFEKSVKSQLMSDRKISLSLSSGNDSTSIFYSMLENNKTFNTISIGYEDSNNYDLEKAIELSSEYGIHNYHDKITNQESFDLICKSISSLSEPIGDSSIVSTYKLSQIAESINSPVLLSGVGGDEVFAGYDRYRGSSNIPRFILNKSPDYFGNLISNFVKDELLKYRLKNKFFDNFVSSGGSRKLFMSCQNLDLNEYFKLFKSKSFEHYSKITTNENKFLYFDLISYLPNLLLSFYDQITMSNTVEGRVPFIDKDLINYCYKFDFKYHAGFSQVRKIFRNAKINKKFSESKKMGFSGPVIKWVDYNYYKFKELIFSTDLYPYFNKNIIENIFKVHEQNQNCHNDIYILFVFCEWKNSLNVS